ncbi:hypothetical protein PDESU_06192 [Pontiella desulfatans]|uniref:Toprim domain-containing protein n=1 Tax=Pontiella desulfatans TaxID=2750659 RepID=A0A6C2UDZ7_PONDE|nr:toprim domain-containing protein [Pontiella desulfatans]VGO17594.1 hypothetical protein PDESU_06192 [Pontiella desulfatans]
MDNQLQVAFETVSICKLAEGLGIEGLREGAGQKNPFRQDRKAGSFSVQRDYFKDHAHEDHKGGHIAFVQLARPGWSKKECIEFIIRTAGMEPEKQSAGRVKAVVQQKRHKLYRAQREKAEQLPSLCMTEPGPWSVPVRERWTDGHEHLLAVADKLAESRGWKTNVLWKLAGLGKTSLPLLPWSDAKGNKRGWGWLVEKPVMNPRSAGRALELVPVGYHTRYKVFPKDAPPEKRWVYTPYVPATTNPQTGQPKRLSDFQQHLLAMKGKLPAYPFVLGNLDNPRLVVVLEGQFDAASFALAFGWLEHGFPPGVSVVGLRGVQSQSVFLSAYGMWLRKNKPFVWIIGDNDDAGRLLDKRDASNAIDVEPTFLDRLRAQGCTVRAELIGYEGAKDFNDVWRMAPPSVSTMNKWAAHVGVPLEVLGNE